MRIENIGSSRNIPDSAQRPGLAEGDVLIAEVTDIKGNKVLLKNQDSGAIFTAKLLNDIGVAVGDYVETVVDEADGGRYVLRVIDISRQSPFLTESGAPGDASAMNQAAKTQMLLSTLAMLKNNPGADPKAAAFLSRHGIAGTAENIESVAQMAKGVWPVTELLSQLIGGLDKIQKAVLPGSQASPAADAAGVPQANATQGSTAQLPVLGDEAGRSLTSATEQSAAQSRSPIIGLQSQSLNKPVSINEESSGVGRPVQNNESQAGTQPNTINVPSVQAERSAGIPNTQTVSTADIGGTVNAQANQPGAAHPDGPALPVTPQPAAVAPQAEQTIGSVKAALSPDVMAETGAAVRPNAEEPIPQPQPGITPDFRADGTKTKVIPAFNIIENFDAAEPKNRELAEKALDILVRMDNADELAVHLKKTVKEMPEQLKELKLLAQDADIKVREAVTQSLDRADKQLSLMNEVKRFDCYQIPLQTGPQQQDTAELFVYRYRGGKKSVDPDNIMILVGLDMQHMGRVETLIKTSGKNLGIEFNVEDMRLADDMRMDAAVLKEAVQQAGYSLLGISVKELTSRTTVLNAEERFDKQADGSAGNLDIRV